MRSQAEHWNKSLLPQLRWALGDSDVELEFFAVSQDGDFHRRADFGSGDEQAEQVRVFDRVVVPGRDDVVSLKAGLGRG